MDFFRPLITPGSFLWADGPPAFPPQYGQHRAEYRSAVERFTRFDSTKLPERIEFRGYLGSSGFRTFGQHDRLILKYLPVAG
jgi:hypothetical protein